MLFIYLLIFKKDLLIYLKERIAKREQEMYTHVCTRTVGEGMEGTKTIFHLLVHSPNGHNGLGWTRPNLEAWNSIWVFHMSAWGLNL